MNLTNIQLADEIFSIMELNKHYTISSILRLSYLCTIRHTELDVDLPSNQFHPDLSYTELASIIRRSDIGTSILHWFVTSEEISYTKNYTKTAPNRWQIFAPNMLRRMPINVFSCPDTGLTKVKRYISVHHA